MGFRSKLTQNKVVLILYHHEAVSLTTALKSNRDAQQYIKSRLKAACFLFKLLAYHLQIDLFF